MPRYARDRLLRELGGRRLLAPGKRVSSTLGNGEGDRRQCTSRPTNVIKGHLAWTGQELEPVLGWLMQRDPVGRAGPHPRGALSCRNDTMNKKRAPIAPDQDRRPWLFPSLRGFRPSWLPHDLIAGVLLTAIAVPEQLATARLAGLPPEFGLIAFVAGSVAFAVFGANRFLSVGADSTIAPIFAGGLAALAGASAGDYARLA